MKEKNCIFWGIFGYVYLPQYVVNFNVIFAHWILREKNYLHAGNLCPSRDKKFLKVYIGLERWCALS